MTKQSARLAVLQEFASDVARDVTDRSTRPFSQITWAVRSRYALDCLDTLLDRRFSNWSMTGWGPVRYSWPDLHQELHTHLVRVRRARSSPRISQDALTELGAYTRAIRDRLKELSLTASWTSPMESVRSWALQGVVNWLWYGPGLTGRLVYYKAHQAQAKARRQALRKLRKGRK